MTATSPFRVLIADDHEGFRHELRHTLGRQPDIQLVAEESNGLAAVQRVRALGDRVDLVLMDIDMPVMDGIAAASEIASTHPDLPVIILTVSTLDRDLYAGIQSGAVGFLNKNLSPATLVRTLRDYRRNGSLPMSRTMARKALGHFQQQHFATHGEATGSRDGLTNRERDVLRRIANGAHDREIAAALVLGETTVKTHVRNILRKLGARNRTEAAARLRLGEPARFEPHGRTRNNPTSMPSPTP